MADAFVRSRSARVSHAGFTLIELLVVVAIIVVISAVILIDNNKFGGQVILENLAYDIALSVRQTQVYGIAVERFGTGTFSAGYGMHFSTAQPTNYILFADTYGTGVYQSSAEIVASTTIQQGYGITSMCGIPYGGTTCTSINDLDILYVRPEPNAYISASQSGTPVSCLSGIQSKPPNSSACYTEADITVISPRGATSTIVVGYTGQISVQ